MLCLERVKGRAEALYPLGRVPRVGIPGFGQSFTLQQEQDVPSLSILFLPYPHFTSSSPSLFFFYHKPCLILFVCFSLNIFFSFCSHLFQLSDSIKQMRHHQKTLHTLLHHPLQPFPGCREGSWEGGYDCWEGGKELVKKGVGGG